jgi:diaminopimelate decarboxylase
MLSKTKNFVKRCAVRWLLWREARGRASLPFAGLAPELWGCSIGEHGRLTVDGVDMRELIDAYGTPLHVVNERLLLESYETFVSSFRAVYANTVLGTSYKTNPVPGVLATLHAAGSYAEVISDFELWLALELGVPPAKIILNGPGKTPAALALAVERGIGIVNIDNAGEIDRLGNLARRRGARQRLGVRVITSVGWSSQFGLSIHDGAAEAAFVEMQRYPELLPSGLHLHLGTGIKNIATYVRAVEEVLQFSDLLFAKHGIVLDHFDLGGGFGVPTVRTMTDWDVRMLALGYPARLADLEGAPAPADYALALAPSLRQIAARHRARRPGQPEPLVILEPGRAITSAGQTLLLSVLAKKTHADKTFLIMDGGKNVTMPLAWETHQIFAANKMRAGAACKTDIFGPLCHPGDVLAKNVVLPIMGPGDVLAIMDAGAYFVPNQMNFSNPRPAIAMVRDSAHTLIRRRESFEDIVRLDTGRHESQ